MKVVFTQAFPPYRKGESAEVASGYALNFLLPKGKAVPAHTAQAQKLLAQVRKAEVAAESEGMEIAVLLDKLQGARVTLPSQPHAPSGKLYAAVPRSVIAQALTEQLGANLPPAFLAQVPALKDPGEHAVTLQSGKKHAIFTLVV